MIIVNQPLPAGAKHQKPNRIIVHAMSQYIIDDGIEYSAFDYLRKIRLSAHALVDPAGVVIRCREDYQGAYHASGYNTDSLGVEFLIRGVHDYPRFLQAMKASYLTRSQYDAGVELVKSWVNLWNINQIDRHSDVSPDRKFDPGEGFPWEKFKIDVGL